MSAGHGRLLQGLRQGRVSTRASPFVHVLAMRRQASAGAVLPCPITIPPVRRLPQETFSRPALRAPPVAARSLSWVIYTVSVCG